MAVAETLLREGQVEYIETYPEFKLEGPSGHTIHIRQVEFPFLSELNSTREPKDQRPTSFLTPTSTEVTYLTFVAARSLVNSGFGATRVIPIMRGAAPILRPAIDVIDGLRGADGTFVRRCVPHPMQTEFYGANIVSGDEPNILSLPAEAQNQEREEIVIEDLADRGKTLRVVVQNRLAAGIQKLGILVPFVKDGADLLEDPRVTYYIGAKIGKQWICHDTDPLETMEALEANVYRHLGVDVALFDDMHNAIFKRKPFKGQEEQLVDYVREYFLARRKNKGKRVV